VFPRFHPGFIFATKDEAETGVKVPVHASSLPVDVGNLMDVVRVEAGSEVVELEAIVWLEQSLKP
jgi:hypothetical protein